MNLPIGIIKNQPNYDPTTLDMFEENIKALRKKGNWNKEDLIKLFFEVVPEFHHKDTGKYLDQRM